METSTIILFSILALVVLALSVYLGFLYSKLRSRKQAFEEAQKRADENNRERRLFIEESLRTLALVLIQEQCDPTEACIRIKKLIDEIEALDNKEELKVFHEMYEEVKHLAIKQEYKDLSKQAAFEQDNQRFAIEEKYSARLKKASKNLRDLLS